MVLTVIEVSDITVTSGGTRQINCLKCRTTQKYVIFKSASGLYHDFAGRRTDRIYIAPVAEVFGKFNLLESRTSFKCIVSELCYARRQNDFLDVASAKLFVIKCITGEIIVESVLCVCIAVAHDCSLREVKSPDIGRTPVILAEQSEIVIVNLTFDGEFLNIAVFLSRGVVDCAPSVDTFVA